MTRHGTRSEFSQMESARATSSVCSLPRLRGRVGLGGGGWAGGERKCSYRVIAPSLSLQPKSDVSDIGQLIKWPNSGKPEFGGKLGRGRCGIAFRCFEERWRYINGRRSNGRRCQERWRLG